MAVNKDLLDRDDIDPRLATAARYQMEHQHLPKLFYGLDVDQLMGYIGSLYQVPGKFLTTLHGGICNELVSNGNNYPQTQYDPSEFSSKPFVGPNEFMPNCEDFIMRVDMPEPERVLLCARIYVCCEIDYSHRVYYTVEKTEPWENPKEGVEQRDCVLCAWVPEVDTPEKLELSHLNFDIPIYSKGDPKLRESLVKGAKEMRAKGMKEYCGMAIPKNLDSAFDNFLIVSELQLIHDMYKKSKKQKK